MDQDGELLRGNTQTLILAVLQQGPHHGYSIAREINRRSGGALTLRQGSLYPALQALERDGLIAGGWEVGGADRPRKVYRLTEAGSAELAKRARSWSDFSRAVNDVLQGALGDQPA